MNRVKFADMLEAEIGILTEAVTQTQDSAAGCRSSGSGQGLRIVDALGMAGKIETCRGRCECATGEVILRSSVGE